MKLNKKGFAVSSIIYSILILFLMLIFGLLSILGTRKLIFDKMKNDVMNKLNGDVVEKEPEVEEPNLAQTLLKDCSETNTVGLIRDTDGSCYYKGSNEEVANNFVWWGGHLWRVISIDSDNTLTMITQQPLTSIYPARAGWATQAEYEASYINHWLNSEEDGVFYKSLEQADKEKIQNSTFNVGGEYNSITSQVEGINSIITTQKIGLLDEIQYTKAGGQNSFLDIKDNFFLGNRYSTSYIRYVNNNGIISSDTPSFADGVRPVIKIANLNFTGSKGTISDPYRENSTTTNTSNIKIGEYISIPTSGNDCGEDKRCLFRVVSKDNDSIKVILNGLLPGESQFGSTATYTSGNIVDTVVTAFANTINANYRYSGTDKTFGIGRYEDRANYIAVQTPTYQGNVGLPVVGEMFSGNDIDVANSAEATKTFVDVATIENPTTSNHFWSMNAYSTSRVRGVSSNGFLGSIDPASAYGLRPVLFINNNLKFTGGEGTAENPFMLGE